MLIRTTIVTGFAAVLLSAAAFADSTPATTTAPSVGTTSTSKPTQAQQKLADRCAALETQFDQAITSHGTAPKAAAAKQLRTKGETLCKSSHQSSGIKNLQQALKDLGLKPNA